METTSPDPQVAALAAETLDRKTFPRRMAQEGVLELFEETLAPWRSQAARMARERTHQLERELQEANAVAQCLEGKMTRQRAIQLINHARTR